MNRTRTAQWTYPRISKDIQVFYTPTHNRLGYKFGAHWTPVCRQSWIYFAEGRGQHMEETRDLPRGGPQAPDPSRTTKSGILVLNAHRISDRIISRSCTGHVQTLVTLAPAAWFQAGRFHFSLLWHVSQLQHGLGLCPGEG